MSGVDCARKRRGIAEARKGERVITVIESPLSRRNAKIRRILAAVDLSPGGKAALQYADKLSRVFGASMTVINVAEVNDGWLLLGAQGFLLLDVQLRENHRRHLIDMVRSGG